RRGAPRVERIVAGQDAEHHGVVCNGPRHRTDVIERKRKRKDAAPGYEPISRLSAHDRTRARGIAHTPPGVGSERHRKEAGGQPAARSRGRSTGMMIAVPGISCGWPGKI